MNRTAIPQLLVSVRSSAEVSAAVAGGAEIIDVKETTRGPLGAASPETWAAVWHMVQAATGGDERPVRWSVAMGELGDRISSPREHQLAPDYAKVGLAQALDSDWRSSWLRWRCELPTTTLPVAVIYADHQLAATPKPLDIIHWALQHNCRHVLVDTYSKGHGSLLDHVDYAELMRWCRAAQVQGMSLALAGSLDRLTIPHVLPLSPSWIAVRGAACREHRDSEICVENVASLREAIRANAAPSPVLKRTTSQSSP